MKKTAFAIMLIFALLFSGAELAKLAEANPYWIYEHVDPVPGTIPPSITIYNPQNYTSYNADSIAVNILVNKAELAGWHCSIEWVDYSIDGRTFDLYPLWGREPGEEIYKITNPSDINFTLSSLASGNHTLTVKAGVAVSGGFIKVFFLDCNSTVFFTTDVAPPVISDLSVENKTYNEFDLLLNFTVDEPASWMGYCLDNEANMTLSGNSTLTLKEGVHSIVFYANDTFGNMGTSEIIYFTIEEPFPTSLVMASSVTITVVLVGLGLLLIGIKRK